MNGEIPVLLVALHLNLLPVDPGPKQGIEAGMGCEKEGKEKEAYEKDDGKDSQTPKKTTVSQTPVQLFDIALYLGSDQNLGYPM
jgi:hypothetical protein